MNFNVFRNSYAKQPLFHISGYPIDLTNLLVGLHILSALVLTFASGGWFTAEWIANMIYTPSAITELRIWTLVTYPFIHGFDLWFALGLYFFWRFGGEIESLLGTQRFGHLYLLLTLVPALGLFALSPLVGNLTLAGCSSIHFAIFIGYALFYPAAAVWFGIPIKWFVIAIVGIETVQYLGYKAWGALAGLWLSIFTAFFYLHWQGVRSCHAITAWISGKTRIRVSFKSKKKPSRHAVVPSISRNKRIDAILDKISSTGFQSLTPEEKAILNESSSRYNNRKQK